MKLLFLAIIGYITASSEKGTKRRSTQFNIVFLEITKNFQKVKLYAINAGSSPVMTPGSTSTKQHTLDISSIGIRELS